MKVTPNECGISVVNSKPFDSGKWKLEILHSGMNLISTEIELKTFNASTLLGIFPSTEDDVAAVNGGEMAVQMGSMVELEARAEGGRPHPTFKWAIEGIKQIEDNESFRIVEYEKSCSDEQNLVCTKASNLVFKLDEEFLNLINKNDTFQVLCSTNQEMNDKSHKDAKKVELKIIYGQKA